jgi:hypothetical protein
MTAHQTSAITFVLTRRLMPDAAICIEYCLRHGYRMAGVVRDDWSEAIRLLRTGFASVIVVADETALDPHRSPRVEVVSHTGAQGAGPAGTRPGTAERTHLVPRQTEGE